MVITTVDSEKNCRSIFKGIPKLLTFGAQMMILVVGLDLDSISKGLNSNRRDLESVHCFPEHVSSHKFLFFHLNMLNSMIVSWIRRSRWFPFRLKGVEILGRPFRVSIWNAKSSVMNSCSNKRLTAWQVTICRGVHFKYMRFKLNAFFALPVAYYSSSFKICF